MLGVIVVDFTIAKCLSRRRLRRVSVVVCYVRVVECFIVILVLQIVGNSSRTSDGFYGIKCNVFTGVFSNGYLLEGKGKA